MDQNINSTSQSATPGESTTLTNPIDTVAATLLPSLVPATQTEPTQPNGKVSGISETNEIHKLNPFEELFCQLYAGASNDCFDNATLSYAVAYKFELDSFEDEDARQRKYNTAKASGSRLLTHDYIQARIAQILRENLTNDKIDEELSWVAKQRVDLGAKMRAINEHNKLQGRIEEKIKHTMENANIMTPEQLTALLVRKEQKSTTVSEETKNDTTNDTK